MSEGPLVLVPQAIVRVELDFDPEPDASMFPNHPSLVLHEHVPGGRVVLDRYDDGTLYLNSCKVARWTPGAASGRVRDLAPPPGVKLSAWLLRAFQDDPRLIPEVMMREGAWTYFLGTRFKSGTGICLPAMYCVPNSRVPDFGCLWDGEELSGGDGVAILEAAA